MSLIAFGSINMDLVVRVPRLPSVGETLVGHEFFSAFGGKGANQAVAIAKLGLPAAFVGRVGGDDFGQTLQLALAAAGVNIVALAVDESAHSGVASIVVSESGDNTIACAAGANGNVDATDVARLQTLLPTAKMLLLELGIPMAAVLGAAQAARTAGVPVLLDPAPASAPNTIPAELYPLLDFITPNTIEAGQLVGFPVEDRQTAERAALILRDRGVGTVLVTLGEQGVLCVSELDAFALPAIPADVRDTVAAGDAFNGAFAAALAQGRPLREAVQWGTVAGAIAVSKPGAQASLPDRQAFEALLSQQG
ncbi:MAG: ribokinase [Spirulinaceae cyanobacterium SM2_1_0]|nr:ribokinase [Spirulinaceae cyanobacterium SM2_1_0]